VHLLVAVVAEHRLRPLLDESVFQGLGAASERGMLGADVRERLVAVLDDYAASARRLGARTITVAGTDPLRRAADSASVVAALEARSGIPFHILSHEEEAFLTLIGVTGGRPVRSQLIVIDIGGGSSELVVAGPNEPPAALGLPLGSARLTARVDPNDPPSWADIESLRLAAELALAEAPRIRPGRAVAVGGTASNLVRVVPAAALDRVLTRARLRAALEVLETETADRAAERHGVNPIRARILPAGAAILDALLDRFGLARIRVAEEGIREGLVLATAHAGAEWRDALPELVLGWVR
jgi:exopolyphosphatase/guanosine-5'-triphosphate,3'-diphosphate pyrophosphatase